MAVLKLQLNNPHVDVINVTLGSISACVPLSNRRGYEAMGAHCHGDGLRG